jgi:hypothetical protein
MILGVNAEIQEVPEGIKESVRSETAEEILKIYNS